MQEFNDYVKELLIEELENAEGRTISVDCLADDLLHECLHNETLTYSTKLAREYLSHWYGEAGEYFDCFHKTPNPFNRPELFMVQMVCEGANILISELELKEKKVVLTPRKIKSLSKRIEKFGEIEF